MIRIAGWRVTMRYFRRHTSGKQPDEVYSLAAQSHVKVCCDAWVRGR